VNMKILVCQITGPAAAWSAGLVPTPVWSFPFVFYGPKMHGTDRCSSGSQHYLIVMLCQLCCVFSSDFLGDLENYTVLKTRWYKQSENQCFHLHMAAILDFSKWLPENAYLPISLLLNVT